MKPIKQIKWAIIVDDSINKIDNDKYLCVDYEYRLTKEVEKITLYNDEKTAFDECLNLNKCGVTRNFKVVKVTTSTVYEIED